jgi:aryl-alcohol dehydrogenase-like predicted oxidoreductase
VEGGGPVAMIARRRLGRTELEVAPLGLGAGALGGGDLTEDEVGGFLNRAVDLGVNLIDTARSYGLSEERIGRHLSWRRREVVLSTKGGYGVEGVPDWTADCLRLGAERALRVLRTDAIDLFHLHSCPLEVLRRDDILEAVRGLVASGKVRVAAYSGEGAALDFAVDCGLFGCLQTSVNVCDQRGLAGAVARAERAGAVVLAKRPLANAPWRSGPPPEGDAAAAAYRRRFQAMRLQLLQLPEGATSWDEAFLRFAAFAPGVTACLVGTRRLAHLEANIAALERGPLPEAAVKDLLGAFARADDGGWVGQI